MRIGFIKKLITAGVILPGLVAMTIGVSGFSLTQVLVAQASTHGTYSHDGGNGSNGPPPLIFAGGNQNNFGHGSHGNPWDGGTPPGGNSTGTPPVAGGNAQADPAISSTVAIADINVANGTALGSAGLPATTTVTLSDATTSTLPVTWNGGTPPYNGSASGTYAFIGTFSSLPTSTTNPNNVTAAVNVIVAPAAAPTSTYTVTIYKFIGGSMATASSALSDAFPMSSTWTAANLSGGVQSSGTFDLGTDDSYQAATAPMDASSSYMTNEDTSGAIVGASCATGDPFALVGYSTGTSLAAAESSTVSTTTPSFTNLASDESVIVWNKICVPAPVVTITTATLPDGMTGVAYGQFVSATSSNPTDVLLWNITGLPSGLGYSTSTGEITGTPLASSTNSLGVTVTGANPSSTPATANISLNVDAPIVSSTVAIADINVANGTALGSAGLPATTTATLSNGTTTVLAVTWNGGTPPYNGSASGTYAFVGTFTLPNGVANPNNVTSAVNVIVAPAPIPAPIVTITTATLPDGTVGVAYDQFVLATSTNPSDVLVWTIANLPLGLGYSTSTGEITGTPVATSSDVLSVTVTGANPSSTPAIAGITLNVDAAPVIGGGGGGTTPSSTVTVTIDKFIDGSMATASSASGDSFPMVSSWNAANLGGAGSGSYALSTVGFNSANPYEAVTSPMNVSSSYMTSEDTTGATVGANCATGDPYALAGYSTGTSLTAAMGAAMSTTTPSFTNLATNENVIVWNVTCAIVTPTSTTGTLTVEKDTIGGNGTFNFSGNNGLGAFSITTASGTGSDTFTNVTPGIYAVTETNVPKGWTQTDNSCSLVVVTAGETNLCIITNTINAKLGEIRGAKFIDKNGNGTLLDDDHNRLAGVTIYLDTNNNGALDPGEPSMVTDKLGRYHFSNLPAGTYTVREVEQAGWTETIPASGSYTIVLGAGKISKNDNFGDFKFGTISGMKFNDLNGNGRKDGNEPGLAGITINLTKVGSPTIVATTVTGANGSYSFTNLSAGTYQVREVQRAGWVQTTQNPPSIGILSGTVSKNDNFGDHFGPVKSDRGYGGYQWFNGYNIGFGRGDNR